MKGCFPYEEMCIRDSRYLHSLKIRQLTVSLIIRTFRHPSINTFYADTAIKKMCIRDRCCSALMKVIVLGVVHQTQMIRGQSQSNGIFGVNTESFDDLSKDICILVAVSYTQLDVYKRQAVSA